MFEGFNKDRAKIHSFFTMRLKFYVSIAALVLLTANSLSKNIFCSSFSEETLLSATDGTGRTVTLKKIPERIISLGAASTEILFEAGAEKQIAAVSSVSDFPPQAKALPKAGGFESSTISFETILAINSDFVIIYKGMHDFLIPQLERFKIPYYISDVQNVPQVIEEITALTKLTGHGEKCAELEEKYNSVLKEIQAKTQNSNFRPGVYYEIWATPFISAGNKSFINSLIELAGGKNIFSKIENPYPTVSEEAIISSNPDFIIIAEKSALTEKDIKARRGWQKISAVQNNRIFFVDDDIFSRPGPRIFQALKTLNGIFHE